MVLEIIIVGGFICVCSVGYFVADSYKSRVKERMKIEAETFKLETLSIPLMCPCADQFSQNVPIDITTTEYKCLKCKKNISVYMNVQNVLKSEDLPDSMEFSLPQDLVHNHQLQQYNELTIKS